jgi:hypothetical protein
VADRQLGRLNDLVHRTAPVSAITIYFIGYIGKPLDPKPPGFVQPLWSGAEIAESRGIGPECRERGFRKRFRGCFVCHDRPGNVASPVPEICRAKKIDRPAPPNPGPRHFCHGAAGQCVGFKARRDPDGDLALRRRRISCGATSPRSLIQRSRRRARPGGPRGRPLRLASRADGCGRDCETAMHPRLSLARSGQCCYGPAGTPWTLPCSCQVFRLAPRASVYIDKGGRLGSRFPLSKAAEPAVDRQPSSHTLRRYRSRIADRMSRKTRTAAMAPAAPSISGSLAEGTHVVYHAPPRVYVCGLLHHE